MFMAAYLMMSGMLFYYFLRPPHSKKKKTKSEVTDGLSLEKTKPILLKDAYTAQEAKSSV